MVSSSKFLIFGFLYFLLTVFSLASSVVVNPKPASAAGPQYGNNRLYLIGEHCHDLNDLNHIFVDQNGGEGCTEWEAFLKKELGCSGGMFYQHEAEDGDKKWYTKQGEFKDCYNRAAAQLNLIEEKCKKVKNDTDLWNDKCEDNQNHLYEALGCNKNFFTKFEDNGDKYWKPIPGAVQDCKNRLGAVASLKLIVIGSDGKPTTADKPISDPSVASSSSDPGQDGSKQEPSCDASFANPLSWILCPVMEMGAQITDGVFQNLVKPLLQDSPIGLDSSNDFYKVWQSFRLIANILLIGILLVLVMSQLTEGWGLNAVDAYTAKKMAPRILIGVIAINLSIYLCVAAIDITNIIGDGLNYLMTKPFIIAGAYDAQTEGNVASGIVGVLGGGVAAGAMGALVAETGAVLTGLALYVLFPILIVVSFASLAVLFTLVVRFSLIIILTVISPIAIACFILPGTEKYFKVWWNQFLKTLMVYPIIAVIFALANIMSVIFITNSTQINNAAGVISLLIGVVAVFTPIFLIPFSFKIAGGMIGTIGKMASATTGGWKDKTMGAYKKDRSNPEGFFGKYQRRSGDDISNRHISGKQLAGGTVEGLKDMRRNGGSFRRGYRTEASEYNRLRGLQRDKEIMESQIGKSAMGWDDVTGAGVLFALTEGGESLSGRQDALRDYLGNHVGLTGNDLDSAVGTGSQFLKMGGTSELAGSAIMSNAASKTGFEGGIGDLMDSTDRFFGENHTERFMKTMDAQKMAGQAGRKDLEKIGPAELAKFYTEFDDDVAQHGRQTAVANANRKGNKEFARGAGGYDLSTMHQTAAKNLSSGLQDRLKEAKENFGTDSQEFAYELSNTDRAYKSAGTGKASYELGNKETGVMSMDMDGQPLHQYLHDKRRDGSDESMQQFQYEFGGGGGGGGGRRSQGIPEDGGDGPAGWHGGSPGQAKKGAGDILDDDLDKMRARGLTEDQIKAFQEQSRQNAADANAQRIRDAGSNQGGQPPF